MNKSITEKELAEKLAEKITAIYHEGSDLEAIMRNIARRAAELLGAEIAPEKPEPGTWHVVAEGPRKGYAAVVQQNGVLVMFNDHGDGYRREPDEDWPALTPARVVPEAEWVRVNNDRGVIAEERDKWKDRAEMRNAKLGLLQAELSDAMETLTELAPAEPTLPAPLTEEQVGELWDKVTNSDVADWIDYQTPLRVAIKRTVNAALAKHGHGRVEVNRYEVRDLISNLGSHSVTTDTITDAIMELLEGSK